VFTARYVLRPPYITQPRLILSKLDTVTPVTPNLGQTAVGQLVAQWLYRQRHVLDHLGLGSLQYQEIFPFFVTTRTLLGAHLSFYSIGSWTFYRNGKSARPVFPKHFCLATPLLLYLRKITTDPPLPCSPKYKVSV
jgi:hypothetical protein